MTTALGRIISRISRMSPEEIGTRLAQEFSRRRDFLLYRAGLLPEPSLAHAAAPGALFFSSAEVPGRVELLRRHLPSEAAAIIAEADAICRHQFRLLGYPAVDYGTEIDW